jgi:purine catabolism regulator
MGITVEDALRFGGLKGARILAGRGGLKNEIRAVDVIEEPYITKWLRSSTLMLTSFYALKDSREEQINLVRELAEAGAAGLVVDQKTYIDGLPEEVLRLADELNLPIIEIPPEVGYIDIINPILNAIFDSESLITKKAEEINELFTNVILKKGGFKDIADILTELTGYPTIILGKSYEILGWSKSGKRTSYDKCLGEIIDTGQNGEIIKTLGFESAEIKTTIKNRITYGGVDIDFIIIPVKIDMEVRGYVMVWGIERPFDKLDLIALENATKVTAIELIKQEAIQENLKRQKKAFLGDLLSGRFTSDDEINDRAARLGINLKDIGAVIVVEICNIQKGTNKSGIRLTHSSIKEFICSNLSKKCEIEVFEDGKYIAVLPKLSKTEDTKKELQETAFFLKNKLEEEIGFSAASFGIGRYYEKPSDIKNSYREALIALWVSRKIYNTATDVRHFDDLGVYKLLGKFEDTKELELFYKGTVYPVKKYDDENNTELVKTLDVYFECGENMASAAETLYIHINTLKYRINRIKEILGVDSFNMGNKVELYIGLKIMKLLQ